tara:strand:- start:1275 stop:1967 length:693 start_codon:yes stop_codon:yes gene_type:complete
MDIEPFNLFGLQHLIVLFIAASIIFGVSFFFRNKDESKQFTAGVSIAVLLIVHEIEQIFNTFTFNLAWQEAIPLHMCDLSAFAIAYYLWKREKIFFNCAFFWGIGGATMALLTPDVDFAYPNAVFLPFFYGHTLILLGVFFSVIALKQRPYLKDVHNVIGISLVLMVIIFFANYLLGDGANFWYLNDKPDNATIMNLFPEPPYHILVTIPVAIALFYIIYLPLWIRDKLS